MKAMDPSAADISSLVAPLTEEFTVDQVAYVAAYAAAAAGAAANGGGEPTAAAAQAAAGPGPTLESAAIEPIPDPFPWPSAWPMGAVSGRYRSPAGDWQLELRVDVDRTRPLNRVSGDYFYSSGGTVTYFGSFVVQAPTISVTPTLVTISGVGSFTFSVSAPKVKVTIPRRPTWLRPAAATLQHLTLDDAPGARYVCAFESIYFRSLELEEDHEQGVTPFHSYDTGSLPSGGPARVLDISKAYAEASIDMHAAGTSNVAPVAPGSSWSNAELHAAMVTQFSLWKDQPQWKVWLLHAMKHDLGAGLLGIMFDQQGQQRQGCAVFYGGSLGGTSAAALRNQLFCCVHELGHCYNLYHSFHKSYMNPPLPNRLYALSWMNYPWAFPTGDTAFWSTFPFQFDDLEVIHLRHAFRDNVIMGANPFGTGAAAEHLEAFSTPIEDESGLRLELEAPPSVPLGTPPVVEIKLYTEDLRGKRVHKLLHPNFGFVQLAISRPGGRVVIFEPPIEHCIEVETVELNAAYPSIYESAYIGYDKTEGVIFDTVGTYTIRAVYFALDGSRVVSNVLTLRVRPPLNNEDEQVAELLLGDEQGMLFYLLGSDAESLQSGNSALDEVLEEHGEHPLAVYARLVKGFGAAREFKAVTADNKVRVRKAQPEVAVQLLSAVVEASEAKQGVDNLTLNMTMQRMARTQIIEGDEKAARATINRMGDILLKKGFKPHVQKVIKAQQAALRSEL
jgi:hypothetical protein